jgi:FkbM family methyltransferase
MSVASSSSSPAVDAVPGWKVQAAALLRRVPVLSKTGLGSVYLRTQRKRRRAARRAAEARGDTHLSRPALYDIDTQLERYLGEVQGGFFVEAGANDGFDQSNTYYLERFRDWSGLLVEPTPHLHREAVLERERSHVVRAALAGPELDGQDLTLHYGGLTTIVSGSKGSAEQDAAYVAPAFELGLERPATFTATARTLSSLLDEIDAPEIDFMSLDVEGFEAEALRGLDLDRHAPRFLLVEAWDEKSRIAVERILSERYRACDELSPHDVLYARADQEVAAA